MSPDDLDKITHGDAINMWHLYQRGMAGPSVNYVNSYYLHGAIHKLTELMQVVHGKNYKPKPPEKFEKLFPDVHSIMVLKDPDRQKKLSLGSQAALALMGPSMPQHIAEKLQGELNAKT